MTRRSAFRGFRFLGCLTLFVGFCLATIRPTRQVHAAPEAPDFSTIPTDAAGVISISFADMWDNPNLKEVRKLVADLKLDDEVRQNFGFRLGDIDRITILLPTVPNSFVDLGVSVVVQTRKPYDRAKILDAFEATAGGREGGAIPGARFDLVPPPAVPKAIQVKEAPKEEAKEEKKEEKKDKDPADCRPEPVQDKDKDADERDLDAPVYFSPSTQAMIFFPSERTVLFTFSLEPGYGAATHFGLLLRKGKKGKLGPVLEAATRHHAVAAFDLARFKRTFGKEIPEDAPGVALLQADMVTAHFDLADEIRLNVTLDTRDPKVGGEAAEAVKTLLDLASTAMPMVRKEIEGEAKSLLPLVDQIHGALKTAKVTAGDKTVAVAMSIKSDGLLAGLIAQAVVEVRKSAERAAFQNNFKQIILSVHNFHDANGHFPFPGYDKNGQIAQQFDATKLSWRVALLPYIEEQQLFQQFKLDEPWDSENNKKLIDKMPRIYAARKEVNLKAGHTFVQMFQGPNGIKPRSTFTSITDGTSNTIFLAEAGEGVIWTKPDDMKFDPAKELPKLGGNFGGDFIVAMGDGSVRFVYRKRVSDATLKLLIQPDDGMPIPNDW